MTRNQIQYCVEKLKENKTQQIRDFNETEMFDFRRAEVYHTTTDKVVNLIRTRCMNLHGRLNAKEFNKLVPFLIDKVVVYDIDL